MIITLQILLILFFPWLAKKISKNTVSWLSPVVLCYTLGILLANVSFLDLNLPIANYFTQGTILLAIPFLLFATNLNGWFKDFKNMVLAFFLCVLCGMIGTSLTGWFFKDSIVDSWRISGMIAAIFSGGIPNMQAVGIALEAESETIVLLNAADIFIGGFYLIFMTTIAIKVLNLFLDKYIVGNFSLSKNNLQINKSISLTNLLKTLGIAMGIIGISVGLSFLIYQELAATFIILCLTTLSLFASRIPFIQRIEGTFEVGDYLLLMFCVAVGMMANFNNIIENGWHIIKFMAMAWGITVLLHWCLCYLFKLDSSTVLIASVAAIYGPVFIGQIASTIDNRRLVFPGIALGLVGIALGNYVGIFVAWLLRMA